VGFDTDGLKKAYVASMLTVRKVLRLRLNVGRQRCGV